MHPLVCSQKAEGSAQQREALGQGLGRGEGLTAQHARAVGASEGTQFSVEAGDRQDERAEASCSGSMSHPTGGRKGRWAG